MRIITLSDKGDCEAETGNQPRCERRAFHQEQWRSTTASLGEYPYTALHEVRITPRILAETPRGTLLIDIGSGPRPMKCKTGALESRDVRVLSCDYEPPETQNAERMDWLVADLRRLPFPLWGHKPLLDGLRSFHRFPGTAAPDEQSVDALRNEVAALIAILEERPVGSCVFSHVLRYLPEIVRERLLNLACQSVAPGGTVHYVERPKAMRRYFPHNQADYDTTDAEFHRLMTVSGMAPVRDVLSVPSLGRTFMQRLNEVPGNAGKEKKMIAWVRHGVAAVEDLSPEKDDGLSAVERMPDGGTRITLGGLRHITYRKPIPAGTQTH